MDADHPSNGVLFPRRNTLDHSDKPILYALMRHLEARTPHYQATMNELTRMAADPNSAIPFTDEERAHVIKQLRDTGDLGHLVDRRQLPGAGRGPHQPQTVLLSGARGRMVPQDRRR